LCFFLYIASPLTLSEVRSMLPPGLVADLAPPQHRTALQQLHPSAKTVALLLVGACSCDLVRPRQADPVEDERELRARYRQAKLSRADVIRELERHRRVSSFPFKPPAGWAQALAAFVVEHARNAGATLYFLEFGSGKAISAPGRAEDVVSCVARDIGIRSAPWLVEGKPIVVA
jgi:hypothetical protein